MAMWSGVYATLNLSLVTHIFIQPFWTMLLTEQTLKPCFSLLNQWTKWLFWDTNLAVNNFLLVCSGIFEWSSIKKPMHWHKGYLSCDIPFFCGNSSRFLSGHKTVQERGKSFQSSLELPMAIWLAFGQWALKGMVCVSSKKRCEGKWCPSPLSPSTAFLHPVVQKVDAMAESLS